VRAVAHRKAKALMDLIYRTLQRPEDVIAWTPANIVFKTEPDGTRRRIIRTRQGKTGAVVEIAITPEIDAIFTELKTGEEALTGPGMPLIHTSHGKPYSYDGLCSMLKRAIAKANGLDTGRDAKNKNSSIDRSTLRIKSFGYYDLKSRGATDMWLAGIPLEQIQVLCGHDSVTTTEIYVKCRWRGTVEPNKVPMSKGME
jgi:integrase